MKKMKRSVPLDDKQYDLFRTTIRGPKMAAKVLSDMLLGMLSELVEAEEQVWDIAKQMAEATDKESVSMNWVQRRLEVYDADATEEP